MLISLLFSYPLLAGVAIREFIADVVFSLVLLSGVQIATVEKRKYFIPALCLAVPAFVLRWLEYSPLDWDFRFYLEDIFAISFLLFTLVTIVNHIANTRAVTTDTIYGAMCVYLLIGLGFALLYSLLAQVNPHAFYIADPQIGKDGAADFSLWIYFSFITLTTLGYGDIIPTLPMTRIICAFEAILGQLYVAVLIGKLIGVHAASNRNS